MDRGGGGNHFGGSKYVMKGYCLLPTKLSYRYVQLASYGGICDQGSALVSIDSRRSYSIACTKVKNPRIGILTFISADVGSYVTCGYPML